MPNLYVTGHDQIMRGVHSKAQCNNPTACVIHRPSRHHMMHWPTYWARIERAMYRTCSHGNRFRDPDDPNRSARTMLYTRDPCNCNVDMVEASRGRFGPEWTLPDTHIWWYGSRRRQNWRG